LIPGTDILPVSGKKIPSSQILNTYLDFNPEKANIPN